MNQFAQAPVQGMLDLKSAAAPVISCQLDSSTAGGILPGVAVKLVDVAGGIPNVVECAANTDNVFGFIAYNVKDQSYDSGDKMEIMYGHDGIMYMTAAAAIAVGASVMIVPASDKVITATTGKVIAGFALDKAAADGDLIRVVVNLPGALA